MSRVAKENAQDGPRSEFMWSHGGQVWVTFAIEDSQVIIGWRLAKEGKVRRGKLESLVGKMLIKEVVVERASTQ